MPQLKGSGSCACKEAKPPFEAGKQYRFDLMALDQDAKKEFYRVYPADGPSFNVFNIKQFGQHFAVAVSVDPGAPEGDQSVAAIVAVEGGEVVSVDTLPAEENRFLRKSEMDRREYEHLDRVLPPSDPFAGETPPAADEDDESDEDSTVEEVKS